MTQNLYTPNSSFIPDVVLVKATTDDYFKRVWFTWRGTEQWLKMLLQQDGFWLIVDTDYTEEFEQYLDEHLEDHDSLESMFEEV
jgi:hypothetical protein